MISKTSVVDSEAGVNNDPWESDGIFSHKYQIQVSQVQRKWEWSYLQVSQCPPAFASNRFHGHTIQCVAFQKECKNLGLETLYRQYVHKMQRSYLLLGLMVQALVTLSHITILLVNKYVSFIHFYSSR